METHAIAMVQTGPRALERQELPLPEHLPPGSALLRVEANGLCGSDLHHYAPDDVGFGEQYPKILGHETVGIVEALPDGTSDRLGVKVGDRVALDPVIGCGRCEMCTIERNRKFCRGMPSGRFNYGTIPTTVGSGLWGGYASHVFVHPDAVLYPIPDGIDALTASLWNALAAGIEWAGMACSTRVGTSIAILGAGQRGLASVIAARDAGASLIVVTGLARDRHKLDLALELGADVAIDVEHEDPAARIAEVTGGFGVDAVVDTTSHDPQPAADALGLVRPGGTIVWYGIKNRDAQSFPINQAIFKGVRIQAAIGLTTESQRRAIDLIASGRYPLERLRTHVFGIEDAERAMDVLAGTDPDEQAINVVLVPEPAETG